MWNFIEKIASSRREGKNRRDGATVSTRGLRHTEIIGEKLFQDEKGAAGMSEEDEEAVRREQRRLALGARAHL